MEHDEALEARFERHYADLRRMARARLRRHETFTLLDTTALVHESFLRLQAADGALAPHAAVFLAYAGRVMRSVIVDAARSRLAQKRSGGVALDTEQLEGLPAGPAAHILHVHEALDALQAADPRLANVIALQYFAGMADAEVALCLEISERTVRRDAQRAQLLLRALLA